VGGTAQRLAILHRDDAVLAHFGDGLRDQITHLRWATSLSPLAEIVATWAGVCSAISVSSHRSRVSSHDSRVSTVQSCVSSALCMYTLYVIMGIMCNTRRTRDIVFEAQHITGTMHISKFSIIANARLIVFKKG
jgi:hypothetical protein